MIFHIWAELTNLMHYHTASRVLAVSGIRVIDGSTFSKSPGTNPQATVMM
jgi:choline dehydrogenase-like flavoprotein